MLSMMRPRFHSLDNFDLKVTPIGFAAWALEAAMAPGLKPVTAKVVSHRNIACLYPMSNISSAA